MKILIYFPGIGEIGAETLIAEIDYLKEFSSGDKLAFYLGIVQENIQTLI